MVHPKGKWESFWRDFTLSLRKCVHTNRNISKGCLRKGNEWRDLLPSWSWCQYSMQVIKSVDMGRERGSLNAYLSITLCKRPATLNESRSETNSLAYYCTKIQFNLRKFCLIFCQASWVAFFLQKETFQTWSILFSNFVLFPHAPDWQLE